MNLKFLSLYFHLKSTYNQLSFGRNRLRKTLIVFVMVIRSPSMEVNSINGLPIKGNYLSTSKLS